MGKEGQNYSFRGEIKKNFKLWWPHFRLKLILTLVPIFLVLIISLLYLLFTSNIKDNKVENITEKKCESVCVSPLWILNAYQCYYCIDENDSGYLVSYYENWAIKERWPYVNNMKDWTWIIYDEEWNVIDTQEYFLGGLLHSEEK